MSRGCFAGRANLGAEGSRQHRRTIRIVTRGSGDIPALPNLFKLNLLRSY